MSQGPVDEKDKNTQPPPGGLLDELESDPNEDPEALLAEAIPDLEKNMKQLQSDFIGLNADIQSIEFGDETPTTASYSSSTKLRLIKFKKKVTHWFINLAEKIFYRLKYFFIWLIIELPKKLLSLWNNFTKHIKSISHVFTHWSGKRRILFIVSFVFLSITLYFYFKLVKSNMLFNDDFHFYGSMEELSDHSFTYDLDGETEPFYNSPRVKVYSFKMKPVVVNLKREKDSDENPMSFFEFIFVGNSGDVVVEFKDRESELIDLVERVIEKKTFESLDTIEGKEELKQDIRKELNKKLTDGVIKKVEIHNFFIKP